MRTLISTFFAFLVSVSLCGCGPRDAAYDPSHFRLHGVLAPPDVVLPKGTRPGAVVDGLYTRTPEPAALCCLIAPHARLVIRKSVTATTLRMGLYVPKVALFERQPQRVRLRFGNSRRSLMTQALPPGFHIVDVKVPPVLQIFKGDVAIKFDCSTDYVPSLAGTGADNRHYCGVLLSMYFV